MLFPAGKIGSWSVHWRVPFSSYSSIQPSMVHAQFPLPSGGSCNSADKTGCTAGHPARYPVSDQICIHIKLHAHMGPGFSFSTIGPPRNSLQDTVIESFCWMKSSRSTFASAGFCHLLFVSSQPGSGLLIDGWYSDLLDFVIIYRFSR